MSAFPNEREKKLGAAIVKYCSELANSSRLNEGAQESMNIAMECLQETFDFADLPTSDVNLLDLVCGPSEDKEEEAGTGGGTECTEYCDFLWQIESKGYFKGCEVGDDMYMSRIQNAYKKYMGRFPEASVKPCGLSWEERKSQAQTLKNAGNQCLKNKEYDTALEKYTEAIRLNHSEATFFSNRAACYMHKDVPALAEKDANRAIQRKPDWAKGYMRLGAAKKASNDLPGATKAYRTALSKCSPDDPLWSQINEYIESCEKTTTRGGGGANPLANMFGGGGMPGMPPMGGGGGPGGMPDFASMMNNPMMQQMAQKFMSDPNMMDKVQTMMQDPAMMDMAKNMMGGGGMPGMGGPGGPGGPPNDEDSAKFMQLMQDPEKMQEVLAKVSQDPELEAMKTGDPEAARILEGLATGDMSMGMQLMQKPDVMVKLRALVGKHC